MTVLVLVSGKFQSLISKKPLYDLLPTLLSSIYKGYVNGGLNL